MNSTGKLDKSCASLGLFCLLAILVAGCATNRVDWESRTGVYTYDQCVIELGPPDKEAKLSDGTKVCEWMTRRGATGGHVGYHAGFGYGAYGPYRWYAPGYYSFYEASSPDYWLRLTFGPEGKLTAWKRLAR
jgi:hypothetical protein